MYCIHRERQTIEREMDCNVCVKKKSSERDQIEFIVQGGEDAEDALNCRSLSAKEPLITGLFCGE